MLWNKKVSKTRISSFFLPPSSILQISFWWYTCQKSLRSPLCKNESSERQISLSFFSFQVVYRVPEISIPKLLALKKLLTRLLSNLSNTFFWKSLNPRQSSGTNFIVCFFFCSNGWRAQYLLILLFFAVFLLYKKNYSFSTVYSGVKFLFFQCKTANSFYSKINDSSMVRTTA